MSFLKLNKLVVTKDGNIVYSEKFHNGINIIRGDNSAGKSTISNLIFYALGGEFTEWLPEAGSCDTVLAELQLNNIIITVKRDIENTQRRPMSIFFGSLDKAISTLFEGWVIHPYSKNEKTESFSQVLFKILNFPEISTDNQESITINQVLRLMYIDQLSALDSLMRNEDFDSPLIRSAIGNLLLGTYDDDLLKKQMSLRKKDKEFSDIKKQVDAIQDVFKNSPFEFDKDIINKEVELRKAQLSKVLEILKNPQDITESVNENDTKNQINELIATLIKIKSDYANFKNDIQKNLLEIIDDKEFISVLESKIQSIKESLNARVILGNLPVTHCPVCLEKLSEIIDDNHCGLCKNELNDPQGRSKLLRMQLELEMQLKESISILKNREIKNNSLSDHIKDVASNLKIAQNNFDVFVNQSRTSKENKFDKLLEQKGKLNAQIDFLEKQLKLVYSYDEYKIQMFALKSQIEELTFEIDKFKELQKRNASTAYTKIQYYALELLRGDGDYEDKFKNGQKITINFSKNAYYLDDRNRFSASSMVLLKNCVRFAIFFASIELDYFRYPRFILCDNIEDKGMVEERSKNFQNNVVRLANSPTFKNKDFQIIYSTSMIAENLNIAQYTIGEFYNKDNKTLKL